MEITQTATVNNALTFRGGKDFGRGEVRFTNAEIQTIAKELRTRGVPKDAKLFQGGTNSLEFRW